MTSKKVIILVGLLLSGSAAWSALVTDDFNRADTDYTTDGSVIGSDWVGNGNGKWRIKDNVLEKDTTGNPSILYNTAESTVSGEGTSFTLSVDVAINEVDAWSGIVFNYLDNQNYYVLRIKGGSKNYQLLRYQNGVQSAIRAPTATGTFVLGTMYTFTITSDTANVFEFTIAPASGGAVMNSITDGSDVGGLASGGYAGFYSASNGTAPETTFDNFSLQAVPKLGTLSLITFSQTGI